MLEREQLALFDDAPPLSVKKIPFEDTKPFILKIHYARRMPSISYAFGLFMGVELVGVCTFGPPASPWLCKGVAGEKHRKDVLELNRLVIRPDVQEKNLASYLVGHSLRQLPKGLIIVSYADAGGWGHIGYVYQATNFMYTGMTKRRTDMYSESGHSRHNCGDTSKRQERTAKHRYVYVTGNVKEIKNAIRYPVEKYPKGDSRHYDTNKPVGIS